MVILSFIFNLAISITLLNVWLVRFNKKTIYRGGDAHSMREEFTVYGLPTWFMYIVGFLKIILALLMIVGIWFTSINLYCYILLSILMIGAIIMHLKVRDPIIKSIPALCVLISVLFLIFFNL